MTHLLAVPAPYALGDGLPVFNSKRRHHVKKLCILLEKNCRWGIGILGVPYMNQLNCRFRTFLVQGLTFAAVVSETERTNLSRH